MKKILFSIALLSVSFLMFNWLQTISPALSEKQIIVHEIESSGAKRIEQKLGLTPYGVGAQMMDQIQVLILIFRCDHPVEIEEGRKLLVDAVNEYLDEINSNEKVRKYLQRYPFRPWNVEILITFLNPEGKSLNQSNLQSVMSTQAKLRYHFISPNPSDCKTYEESFEEAYRIVKEEKQKATEGKPLF